MSEQTVSEQRAVEPQRSEQPRSNRVPASIIAGVIIGAVEALLAVSLAALVFGGYLVYFLADGIGVYLGAAALTLAILAWRAGTRGVVGSMQESVAAVRPSTPSAASTGHSSPSSPPRWS